MTPTRKRRWLLATVAVGVVVGVVGFVVLHEPRKGDLGRLSFSGFSEYENKRVAWFRYEVPTWRLALTNATDSIGAMDATLGNMRIRCGPDLRQELPSVVGAPMERVRQLRMENGWITQFSIEPPKDEIWCLEMPVCVRNVGFHRLASYVRILWQTKSFPTLRSIHPFRIIGTVRSELITNAVPKTAGTPGN
jgi:hypothetical protein